MIESAWSWTCATWTTLLALPWGTFSSMVQVLVFPLTLAATIAVLVTLRLTTGQLRYTRAGFQQSVRDSAVNRRASEQSRVEATAAADRAENAARGTIDALGRVAQQVEAVATHLSSPEVNSATSARAEWRLSFYQGSTFQLDNIGGGTAYEVGLEHDPTLRVMLDSFEEGGDIPAGEARTFLASASMGTRDRTITVSWRASPDADEREVWRYPLPPKA